MNRVGKGNIAGLLVLLWLIAFYMSLDEISVLSEIEPKDKLIQNQFRTHLIVKNIDEALVQIEKRNW
ncbi:MAG: hypothetical protein CME65_01815 [Halobacteriovoraceae bacterium]|nr:hypothetical protein [Halobacteriovoraceae bacterium]|tara:strand:+ start:1474 stop:1674 length:201 start_codon:yes stop_codon:yes gene_type:complete